MVFSSPAVEQCQRPLHLQSGPQERQLTMTLMIGMIDNNHEHEKHGVGDDRDGKLRRRSIPRPPPRKQRRVSETLLIEMPPLPTRSSGTDSLQNKIQPAPPLPPPKQGLVHALDGYDHSKIIKQAPSPSSDYKCPFWVGDISKRTPSPLLSPCNCAVPLLPIVGDPSIFFNFYEIKGSPSNPPAAYDPPSHGNRFRHAYSSEFRSLAHRG